jgi:2-succinyl-6-hydroxy-2,4-cyclohexadiene-1-carboxylate synthase
LHCSFAGDSNNPTLLFLHGFLGSSSDWKYITNKLSSDYYCIAIDLPGHGLSEIDDSKDSFSIENTARYISEILQKYKIEKCDLLGYSMGGRIAIYLAVHYPEYFNKIIIESAQPGLDDEIEKEQRLNHDKQIAQKLLSEPFPEFLEYWYNQPIFETLKNHKNFANLLQSRLNNKPKKLAKSLKEIGAGTQPSLWEELRKIENPCLLIAGEFDTKYQKIFSKMHKEIYSSNFVVIKNSGHNTHFENLDEFIKVVRKFSRN